VEKELSQIWIVLPSHILQQIKCKVNVLKM
jgi:hypothetical protein